MVARGRHKGCGPRANDGADFDRRGSTEGRRRNTGVTDGEGIAAVGEQCIAPRPAWAIGINTPWIGRGSCSRGEVSGQVLDPQALGGPALFDQLTVWRVEGQTRAALIIDKKTASRIGRGG